MIVPYAHFLRGQTHAVLLAQSMLTQPLKFWLKRLHTVLQHSTTVLFHTSGDSESIRKVVPRHDCLLHSQPQTTPPHSQPRPLSTSPVDQQVQISV